ncbi:hypothetical protein BT69DRAFT_1343079 [Atractiella rhizophila]|nr:hypothetical protein BT69DRAFT_1343079 [Atractiella rhizophila]
MQRFVAKDKQGNEIKSVGVYHPESVSKNSYVALETLQSLYLSPRWTEPPSTRTHSPNPSIEVTEEEQEEKEERKKIGFTYIPTTTNYMPVRFVPMKERKRIVVTGGAGFVGSHLVDR